MIAPCETYTDTGCSPGACRRERTSSEDQGRGRDWGVLGPGKKDLPLLEKEPRFTWDQSCRHSCISHPAPRAARHMCDVCVNGTSAPGPMGAGSGRRGSGASMTLEPDRAAKALWRVTNRPLWRGSQGNAVAITSASRSQASRRRSAADCADRSARVRSAPGAAARRASRNAEPNAT